MWSLINESLRKTSKRNFNNIIVDDSYFSSEQYPSSRPQTRSDRAYDAPVGALSFNWNSVNIYIQPGHSIKTPLKVFIDPENDFLTLSNSGKTASGKRNALQASRKGNTVSVGGQYGVLRKEKAIYKSIKSPSLWAGHQLKSFAKQRGYSFSGTVKKGSCSKTKLIAHHSNCLLYTSPSPRDATLSRMPSSA